MSVESATTLLEVAQKVHDEVISNAHMEADKVLSRAKKEQMEILSATNREASRLLENAESEAREKKAQLSQELQSLEEKLSSLRLLENEYNQKMREIADRIYSQTGQGE